MLKKRRHSTAPTLAQLRRRLRLLETGHTTFIPYVPNMQNIMLQSLVEEAALLEGITLRWASEKEGFQITAASRDEDTSIGGITRRIRSLETPKEDTSTTIQNTDRLLGLRNARIARGFTQQELGQRAYVHAETVSRLERGFTPTVSTLARIARALEVEPMELYRSTPRLSRSGEKK